MTEAMTITKGLQVQTSDRKVLLQITQDGVKGIAIAINDATGQWSVAATLPTDAAAALFEQARELCAEGK